MNWIRRGHLPQGWDSELTGEGAVAAGQMADLSLGSWGQSWSAGTELSGSNALGHRQACGCAEGGGTFVGRRSTAQWLCWDDLGKVITWLVWSYKVTEGPTFHICSWSRAPVDVLTPMLLSGHTALAAQDELLCLIASLQSPVLWTLRVCIAQCREKGPKESFLYCSAGIVQEDQPGTYDV